MSNLGTLQAIGSEMCVTMTWSQSAVKVSGPKSFKALRKMAKQRHPVYRPLGKMSLAVLNKPNARKTWSSEHRFSKDQEIQ